jgi:RNA polymerase sigma-70 factor (ECF subfamily)
MNLKNYEDIELLEMLRGKIKLRDEAFKEIYSRYSKLIHGFIFSYIKDSDIVEDIFQDIFIKFFDYAQKYDIKNIQSFLIVSSKNLCINHLRNKKHNIEINDDILSTDDLDRIEKNELIDLILTTLDLLDSDYKQCFMMREFEGLSYAEIGKLLGITADNAKVRNLRAKRKVIELLQPYLKDLSK